MTRYTVLASTALALALHLAGCDKTRSSQQSEAAPAATTRPGPRPLTRTASFSGETPAAADRLPGPADRDPDLALAYWRRAMESRDWAGARRVFGEFGQASGMSAQDFARAWDKYQTLTVRLGPGQQDAGAGSSYYQAPVTITGATRTGAPYRLAGQLTLRRVNDIEGATDEQLRWHIERSTLRP